MICEQNGGVLVWLLFSIRLRIIFLHLNTQEVVFIPAIVCFVFCCHFVFCTQSCEKFNFSSRKNRAVEPFELPCNQNHHKSYQCSLAQPYFHIPRTQIPAKSLLKIPREFFVLMKMTKSFSYQIIP